jgi:hypothetical protein
MEICITVDAPPTTTSAAGVTETTYVPNMSAFFTMVARHPVLHSAFPVNRLEATTDAERGLFERGKINAVHRRERALASLQKQPPTEQERLIIHDLYLKVSLVLFFFSFLLLYFLFVLFCAGGGGHSFPGLARCPHGVGAGDCRRWLHDQPRPAGVIWISD